MFPGTAKIDEKIAELRLLGFTPETSNELRDLLIAQASAWFPRKGKMALAEEHLVERRMIPPKTKNSPNFASGKLQKKVMAMIPRS
ncbi:MAG: hypothetical protein AAB556_00335 [Patescibacteria group bacterium]